MSILFSLIGIYTIDIYTEFMTRKKFNFSSFFRSYFLKILVEGSRFLVTNMRKKEKDLAHVFQHHLENYIYEVSIKEISKWAVRSTIRFKFPATSCRNYVIVPAGIGYMATVHNFLNDWNCIILTRQCH